MTENRTCLVTGVLGGVRGAKDNKACLSTSCHRSEVLHNRVNMGEDKRGNNGKLNITFSGCGFLGIYHVGVASALKDRAPRLLERIENFGGASAGALAAGSLLCGMSLSESLDFTLRLAERANKLSVGPFHPRFQLTKTLRKVFTKMVPADAYKRCSGKLHISLTRCSDWQNVVASEFRSNEDLVDVSKQPQANYFLSGYR